MPGYLTALSLLGAALSSSVPERVADVAVMSSSASLALLTSGSLILLPHETDKAPCTLARLKGPATALCSEQRAVFVLAGTRVLSVVNGRVKRFAGLACPLEVSAFSCDDEYVAAAGVCRDGDHRAFAFLASGDRLWTVSTTAADEFAFATQEGAVAETRDQMWVEARAWSGTSRRWRGKEPLGASVGSFWFLDEAGRLVRGDLPSGAEEVVDGRSFRRRDVGRHRPSIIVTDGKSMTLVPSERRLAPVRVDPDPRTQNTLYASESTVATLVQEIGPCEGVAKVHSCDVDPRKWRLRVKYETPRGEWSQSVPRDPPPLSALPVSDELVLLVSKEWIGLATRGDLRLWRTHRLQSLAMCARH